MPVGRDAGVHVAATARPGAKPAPYREHSAAEDPREPERVTERGQRASASGDPGSREGAPAAAAGRVRRSSGVPFRG